MNWIIDKTFEFCYGHRVWTQLLDGEYADDLKCACRHLHGHEAKVQVYLTADRLNQSGMVTDFRHLEWLKRWLNEYVDHRFVIDANDPLYPSLLGTTHPLVNVIVPGTDLVAGKQFDVNNFGISKQSMQYEFYEGFLVVDFVPTSENLAAWIAEIVDAKMNKLGVRVDHVDWWETPKSRSTYRKVD